MPLIPEPEERRDWLPFLAVALVVVLVITIGVGMVMFDRAFQPRGQVGVIGILFSTFMTAVMWDALRARWPL